jgi:predicted house-cleaning noncanonical NTP pyrophosphatase (MazG superfamily)
MKSNNECPSGVRRLNNKEYISELIKKVIEEVEEMRHVKDTSELKKELADVQEVLDYLKKVLKLSKAEMKRLQDIKKLKNGGFSKRLYVESVGVEESNEWYSYYTNNPDKYPEVANK